MRLMAAALLVAIPAGAFGTEHTESNRFTIIPNAIVIGSGGQFVIPQTSLPPAQPVPSIDFDFGPDLLSNTGLTPARRRLELDFGPLPDLAPYFPIYPTRSDQITSFDLDQTGTVSLDMVMESLAQGRAIDVQRYFERYPGVNVAPTPDFRGVVLRDLLANPMLSRSTRNRIWDGIPPDQRNLAVSDGLMNDLEEVLKGLRGADSTVQQVAPGTGVDNGIPGVDGCTGAGCGTGFAHTGEVLAPACPQTLCPNSRSPILGCAGELCQFPPRQDLGLGSDGRSLITYHIDGFPEVAIMSVGFGGGASTNQRHSICSATVLTQNLVLTALHCLSSNASFLEMQFSFSSEFVPGWRRMMFKETSTVWYDLAVTVNGMTARVEEISVPYGPNEEFNYSNGRPSRDIALLHLAGEGFPMESHQFPLVDFKYAQSAESISFAGFGWTNVGSLEGDAWTALSRSDKWSELRQAAFNFTEGFISVGSSENKLLSWINGTPIGTGGPCLGDSGGPIYAGFNRGYWNNPRLVIGVVSGGTGSVSSAAGCLSDQTTGFGEDLRNYQAGVCSLGKQVPRGCPNSSLWHR